MLHIGPTRLADAGHIEAIPRRNEAGFPLTQEKVVVLTFIHTGVGLATTISTLELADSRRKRNCCKFVSHGTAPLLISVETLIRGYYLWLYCDKFLLKNK